MENQEPIISSVKQILNPESEFVIIAKRRPLIRGLFAITIVFFFFNFFTISCGGQKIDSLTGLNLVTGTELANKDAFSGRDIEGEKVPMNIWAITSFVAAVFGFFIYLTNDGNDKIGGAIAGLGGFIALIILRFSLENSIQEKTQNAVQIETNFAYWAALIAMLVAGIFSLTRHLVKDQ